jgi:methylenetetrahydrofolate--tRNA-(uracil-5-)-methyltransferase
MPPATTALGAIISHITGGANDETFQPMNVNFGLFPEIETKDKGRERKKSLSRRALQDIDQLAGQKCRRASGRLKLAVLF